MEGLRSFDTLEEIKEDTKSLRIIGTAYAGRSGVLTAVLQYVYQTVALAGCGRAEEGRAIEALAARKLYDLELLGTLIQRLGASPVYTACPPYPVSHYSASCVDYSKTFRSMLRADLALEERTEEMLLRMADEVENPAVRKVLGILLDDGRACAETLKGLEARL